jgi:methyltransferase (TIGR00027 family)
MQEGRPSHTALGVARRRAAHQIFDYPPLIFDDPVAVRILGPDTQASLIAEPEHKHPIGRAMRAFLVARSRFAEDFLNRSVAEGVTQYVILGAGLDTFAYRNPHAQLKVFEVDHPATQQWKRQMLADAGIEIPASVTFASVDFESQTLRDGLAQTGFDFSAPAFFSWLGVTPYLTLEAFRATIRTVASMAEGSSITFEYMLKRSLLSFTEKIAVDMLAERVAMAGEPFRLFFSPEEIQQELRGAGFRSIEAATLSDIHARYFQKRRDGLELKGSAVRLVVARL